MRHRKSGVKLNRTTSHRQAMFRNMVTSLLKHERIKTTDAKAKELRRWADHIVTLAKRGDLHARRMAMSIVREKAVVHKIFEEAPKRFGSINGGYTRIIKIGRRPGDAAAMTLVELVRADGGKATPSKTKKTKAPSTGRPVATQAVAKGTETAAAQSAAAVEGQKSSKAADVDATTLNADTQAAATDEPVEADSKTTTDPAEDDK